MTQPDDDFSAEMQKPRIGFLISSAIAAFLAAAAYIFEDDFVNVDPDDSGVTFALLIIVLVLAAMFLLLCYRVPRIGNRLLGYDKLTGETQNTVKSDVQYTAGLKTEGAVEAKQMSSRRKQARHSRKKLAAVTREMQQQAKDTKAESAAKDDSNN